MRASFRVLTLGVLVGAVSAAQAVVFVDDFNTAQTGVTLFNPGNGASAATSLGSGISRTLLSQQFDNSDPGNARSRDSVKNGAFDLSNDVEVRANGSVSYTFATPTSYAGLTGFRLDFLSNDVLGSATVQVFDQANHSVTYSKALPISLSAFSLNLAATSGSADLTKVSKITVLLDATGKGQDVRLDKIQSVPEPASLAVLAVGALGIRRRRRN